MSARGGRPGTALFLASVMTFVVVDFVFLMGPQLSLPMAKLAPALSYVLLAGFALALAVIASVVIGAWRARAAPGPLEVLRGSVALILVALHVALIVVAKRR